jgi:putative hemolysin
LKNGILGNELEKPDDLRYNGAMKNEKCQAWDFPTMVSNNFEIRLVKTEAELNEVLKLRYQDLLLYYNANNTNETGLFTDRYDAYCDHLIVVDRNANVIAGTYRLVRKEHIARFGKFISENEYDIQAIKDRNIMELGRAVVRKDYRNGAVIMLLWKGIFAYASANKIEYLFGTASFSGVNLEDYHHGFSYLYYHYLGEKDIPAIGPNQRRLDLLPESEVDPELAKKQLPPLVKGYVRIGARFGKDIFIDVPFNSLDVFVLLDVNNLDSKYVKKIME